MYFKVEMLQCLHSCIHCFLLAVAHKKEVAYWQICPCLPIFLAILFSSSFLEGSHYVQIGGWDGPAPSMPYTKPFLFHKGRPLLGYGVEKKAEKSVEVLSPL